MRALLTLLFALILILPLARATAPLSRREFRRCPSDRARPARSTGRMETTTTSTALWQATGTLPNLTFFSGANEHDGWQSTMDRYLSTYASPGREMGQLDFSGLRVVMLGPDDAFVRGNWKLTMSDGKNPARPVHSGLS